MAQFDKTCPSCTIGLGVPKAVTAAHGLLTITLACDKCGRRWDTEGNEDFDFFFRSRRNKPRNQAPSFLDEDIGRQAAPQAVRPHPE